MKKTILLTLVVLSFALITACNTVTSQVSYPEPVVASDTKVFHGNSRTYRHAREKAIEKATAAGYSKILLETTEFINLVGEVVVSLTMVE